MNIASQLLLISQLASRFFFADNGSLIHHVASSLHCKQICALASRQYFTYTRTQQLEVLEMLNLKTKSIETTRDAPAGERVCTPSIYRAC